MALRSQKYWLEPEKYDAVIDALNPTYNEDGLAIVELPTTDPQVAGALWNDSGTVKVSAGV